MDTSGKNAVNQRVEDEAERVARLREERPGTERGEVDTKPAATPSPGEEHRAGPLPNMKR